MNTLRWALILTALALVLAPAWYAERVGVAVPCVRVVTVGPVSGRNEPTVVPC